MISILIHFLLTAAKACGSKLIDKLADRLIDLLDHRKLVFTKTAGVIHYSHYVGQNHVRNGGQKKIYHATLSLTLYNPDKASRSLRDLALYVTVDAQTHPFRLYSSAVNGWQENMTIPPHHVTGCTWDAALEGHGISIAWGADGVIPIEDLDSASLHLSFLNEHGRRRQIPVESVKMRRLPKEQIAE
jgi:hypothetical protein